MHLLKTKNFQLQIGRTAKVRLDTGVTQRHPLLSLALDPGDVHKLVAELRTLPFIDASLAVKIADILPQYPEEVRLLFAKERVVLEEEQLTRLLELVAQYR